MKRVALTALLSHWWRNPLQVITLLTGLALATALWSGVQAINSEARASYSAAADRVGQGQFDRLIASAEDPLTLRDYVALRRAGWQVSPQVDGTLQTSAGSVQIIGVEPLSTPPTGGFTGLAAVPLDGFFRPPGFAIASPEAAPMMAALGIGFEIGPDLESAVAFVDIGIAQALLKRGDVIDRLLVLEMQPIGLPDLRTVIPHATRVSAQTGSADIARLTDSFHLNLTAFGLLSFAVGLFIVYGAIGLAFEQRRGMFRTLRAIGVPLRDLVVLLCIELILLACVAGAAGIALGYGIAAALLPDVAATLRGLYGADVPGDLAFRPEWWLPGFAMALGGTLFAGAGAVWRLSRLPLLEAGTPQAWTQVARRLIKAMAVAGLTLLGLAAALTQSAAGLVAGFAMLGALLVGAALLLPLILDEVLGWIANRSAPGLPEWFWADTRQQIPGLSMALMALLLAISANIGVSTMVSSFRLTFTGWLDQRLAAELYVTTRDADQAAAMVALLEGRVDAILPIMSADIMLNGQPGDVFAIADHATYRDNWPLLSAAPDVWTQLQIPGHAIVNEQLALRAGLGLGDQIADAQIVGVYSDYGNPAPQMIIGLAAFEAQFPDVVATRFGLRLPASDVGDVMALLQTELALPADAMADQAQIKALSLRIFEQTFTVTSALNILTLSVAGFSILMSLLTLSQMRLPQLAPVWALGVTRAQLGRMELWRAVAIAALVTVLALPLGLALAWVLLAVVNVFAFGWRLPMYLFPGAYGWLALSALLAALLAASWPAWRLAHTAPHRLLQVFSAGR